jgi:cytochrome b subunit of formate dehydrogenase
MGFNPFREQRSGVLDIALVVGFVIIITGFVIWAMFG